MMHMLTFVHRASEVRLELIRMELLTLSGPELALIRQITLQSPVLSVCISTALCCRFPMFTKQAADSGIKVSGWQTIRFSCPRDSLKVLYHNATHSESQWIQKTAAQAGGSNENTFVTHISHAYVTRYKDLWTFFYTNRQNYE